MSDSGLHLSAESLNWSVAPKLGRFLQSPLLTVAHSAIWKLLPLLPHLWVSKHSQCIHSNTLTKQILKMARKKIPPLTPGTPGLLQLIPFVVRSCAPLVRWLSPPSIFTLRAWFICRAHPLAVARFAEGSSLSLSIPSLNPWERMCVHEAATGGCH
jgi:hypothetical protein